MKRPRPTGSMLPPPALPQPVSRPAVSAAVTAAPVAETPSATAQTSSVTELLAKALDALHAASAQRQGLTIAEILSKIGCVQAPPELIGALQSNPKVESRADQRLYYKTKYDARDRFELSRLISSLGDSPLLVTDLVDLYPGAHADIDDMTRKGEVVRIRSVDRLLPDVVYSRDLVEASRVRLSGTVSVTAGSAVVRTSSDLASELFRNDVIIINNSAYRISSEPENYKKRAGAGAAGGDDDDEEPAGAAGPGSQPPDGAGASSSAGGSSGGSSAPQIAILASLLGIKQAQAGAAPAAGAGHGAAATAAAGAVTAGPPPSESPPTGVYRVSIANGVKATGGMFSAGDTAPHVLRAPQTYAQPFTATQLVLDRPWSGPSGTALIAYRLGATGDLRVLWREMVTHGQVALTAGPGAGAASSAGAGSSSEPGAEGSTLMLSLGGSKAFKSLPSFPMGHREVREELRKMGIITKMLPGTMDVAPMAGAGAKRAKRVRTLDKRVLNLTTAGHLSGATLEAVKAAQLAVVRKELIAKQQAAAQHAQRSVGR